MPLPENKPHAGALAHATDATEYAAILTNHLKDKRLEVELVALAKNEVYENARKMPQRRGKRRKGRRERKGKEEG